MSSYSDRRDSTSSGVRGGSWSLKKQFSSQESPEEPWPDLLMDKNRSLDAGSRTWRHVDPLVVERNNLVSISQLVIKNLVDSTLKSGRMVDEDNIPLQQFFVLINMVFKHGFKSGRRLIYSRDIWDLLQTIEKLEPASLDLFNSVRGMKIKTNGGRARAWYRLALMQKKLPDYFKLLVDHKNILLDFYHAEALMCCEEAVLLAGLMVSLNIIDFNLFIKDEDFDSQENVIDLSMYLRRKEDIGRTEPQEVEEMPASDLQTIIDQKNYVEEINRNLAANVTNYQAKIEKLNNTNLLMVEDLAISKRKLKDAEKEKKLLEEQLEAAIQEAQRQQRREMEISVNSAEPTLDSEMEQRLAAEQVKTRQVEKELAIEIQMKAECEIAMKLMEKDVHEKQDTIISLRAQLEDIKAFNLEMNTKLAECKKTIEVKHDMIEKLEGKTGSLMDTLQQLDDKYVESEKTLAAIRANLRVMDQEVKDKSFRIGELEQDLKIEREWRERLQETNVSDREAITKLKQETDFLRQVSNDYENIRRENGRLREMSRENDKTLEELGQQLSWNKLQLDSMKEETQVAGAWERDSDALSCKLCDKEFNIARRKHHCRNCGGIFCDSCSDNKMELPSSGKKLRVCDNCYTLLIDRQSKLI